MKASSSVILAAIMVIMALLKSPVGDNDGNDNDGHYFCFVLTPNQTDKHLTRFKNLNLFRYLTSKSVSQGCLLSPVMSVLFGFL